MSQFRAHAHGRFLLRVAHQHVRHRAERRIAHHAPEVDLLFVEPLVILRGGELNGVMIGIDGLHQHDARKAAPPRASRYLRQQLKGPLAGAKIGHAEADIRRHHAHQRHVRDVVALGDHLRAHENVVIAFAETLREWSRIAACR